MAKRSEYGSLSALLLLPITTIQYVSNISFIGQEVQPQLLSWHNLLHNGDDDSFLVLTGLKVVFFGLRMDFYPKMSNSLESEGSLNLEGQLSWLLVGDVTNKIGSYNVCVVVDPNHHSVSVRLGHVSSNSRCLVRSPATAAFRTKSQHVNAEWVRGGYAKPWRHWRPDITFIPKIYEIRRAVWSICFWREAARTEATIGGEIIIAY